MTRRDYTNITNAKSGSGNKLVHDLYANRPLSGFPRNKPPRPRADPPRDTDGELQRTRRPDQDTAFNQEFPQAPVNQRAPGYFNDCSGWVRSCREGEPQMRDESGEHKPFFDKMNVWRGHELRDQIKDHHDVDHNRHHTEFELRHNAGMTHSPDVHDPSKRSVPAYERQLEYGLDAPASEPKERSGAAAQQH